VGFSIEACQDAVLHHDRSVEVGRSAPLNDAKYERRANRRQTIKDFLECGGGEIEGVAAEVSRFDEIPLEKALWE
jgi:hypothetical protein